MARTFILTGAAGFMGSALTVALARCGRVIAIDRRAPSLALRQAAPEAEWHAADIADAERMNRIFAGVRGAACDVLHFAAFYHFGADERPAYAETNVRGTENVLASARAAGVRRILFASSVAALEPPRDGSALTEESPALGWTPYGRSKAAGEALMRAASGAVPSAILRIGGAFIDNCGLPPLYSLMRMWRGNGPFARIIAGRGETAIPFIHRDDLVALALKALDRHAGLDRCVTLHACAERAVPHAELFAAMQAGMGRRARPWQIPVWCARAGLHARCACGAVIGRMPFERPWMLDYVDRPWRVESARTRAALSWACRPDREVLAKMPELVRRMQADPAGWDWRNIERNEARYAYEAEMSG